MLRRLRALAISFIVFAFFIVEIPAAQATTSWTPPLEISAPLTDSNAPQVVSDSSGNFITLFQNKVGSNFEIRSSYSTDFGTTWSAPATISSGTSAVNPNIISVGPRAFVAVWNQNDGTTTRVASAKTTDNGVTWSSPVYISIAGQNTRAADIAFDGQNSLGVVWTRQLSGFTYSTTASGSSDLGTTWATPQDLTSTTPGSISPQIASTGTGSFVAMWHRLTSPVGVQSSSTTNSGTTWSAPTLASDAAVASSYPQLVSTSSNKVVATWLQDISSVNVLSSSISLNNGATWSTPVRISNPSSTSTAAQLIRTANGTLVSVWYQNIGSGDQILSSRSVNDGAAWSAPTLVSSQTACYIPQIAADSSSTLTVAWLCGQSPNSVISVSTSTDNASSWAQPTALTQSPLFGDFVSLAVSPAGDTTAAWQMNYSGQLYKVYSSSYIVSVVPPQPQPNTLPPTGVNSSLEHFAIWLLASGVVFLGVRRISRKKTLPTC
ncbi:sialidase family protein [Aurantimicrobium minutum]|uniref:sialidase family protein n=1 Tax=Aurantimicrobium minutum TaxID=708131 RepID=UPI0024740F9D|nr:sialidase family protein [Aurantimicrobium minutum]MDH6423310.1 hypothetical protein [Aurantimicrobium minutum]